ncbi:MAG: hypothetical protein IT320_07965 [Anaerolineae bacterium]|nr:hypothetical protein [Anaerolineae bacterium]
MYAVPQSFKNLVRNLTVDAGSPENARLLAYVEITLTLAMQLGLESEPLSVGWVLLSRMPLHHVLLKQLSSDQERMLANAAIIIPLSSRFAWESALVRYIRNCPSHLRLYDASLSERLDQQSIALCRIDPSPDPLREDRYVEILMSQLPFEQRSRRLTKAGETYRVRVRDTHGEMHHGQVTITEAMQQHEDPQAWFERYRPRTVISLRHEELLPTAQYLDQRESILGGRIHWVHDLQQIRFRRASRSAFEIMLEPDNAYPLHLEGSVHIPGMVSAGKTTLAKLIIAHCIRMGWDARITLVVGDSHSAIEIANQVNNWFNEDPSSEEVFAVPLLGTTQRETHLGRLLASREYARSLESGHPHWGERWLMPACPLASQIRWDADADVTIPAGNEPCEDLMSEPRAGRGRRERHVCPLFRVCPSKQIFRDMPNTQVWVTTPGALSQASLPLHLDSRVMTMGDLVYEQSDLVILDEVETIVDWFDRAFALKEEITNGRDGLLDRLDTQITRYFNENRVLPADYRRWVITARESLKALSGVLTAIADHNQTRTVRNWVKRGYFSPNQLAYRFARRLAGLKEWDTAKTAPGEKDANEQRTKPIFDPFNQLLNRIPDVLRYQLPPNPTDLDHSVGGLAAIMQTLNNLADDATDQDVLSLCVNWILRWHPDIDTRLNILRKKLSQSNDGYDQAYLEQQMDRSVDELAQRLRFLLTVALLDRHIHIVIEEWHNKPETLDAQQPFGKMPKGMKNILPLPLTGQQYGFAIEPAGTTSSPEAANRLSLFAYTNIGRSYLLNFHRLRIAFDGMPGPHVLALSGTSYLPDSTAFNVTIPLAGVLMAPEPTEQAIQDSRFIWQYFTDKAGNPITISGAQDKEQQFRLLMTAMLDFLGVPGGFLGNLLEWLEQQGTSNPDQWADRARILLLTNSYRQARVAAQVLRDRWRAQAHTIFDLKRGSSSEDFQIEMLEQTGGLHRIDIEQFASMGGRILIAPMQSIGRGFNILNTQSKAAFGAVCFLTRPMSQPHDMQAKAQELNRFALQWANDPSFEAWKHDTLYVRAMKAREMAVDLRRMIEQRHGYIHLHDNSDLKVRPRRDLAATTAGRIVQAVGRLLRGGVPFRAFFVDAAWSPQLARSGDTDVSEEEATSLLTAMINVLSDYSEGDEIGKQLYGGLNDALTATDNRDGN